MASSRDINTAHNALDVLNQRAEQCQSVGHALIETRRRLVSASPWQIMFIPTDHERCRGRVIRAIQQARRQVHRLQLELLNPDLIRLTTELDSMTRTCWRCPRTNTRRLRQGQPFTCRLLGRGTDQIQGNYRFHLNAKGEIVGQ
ncbi:MAG: hypothetical protein HND57_01955 [Planctomycetes bacterium]|nr:hypothetical protein [Planctomycetota bacterium]